MKDKQPDDKLDPKAKGKKTATSDFDRNRDGLYGGLPKARDKSAPGPPPSIRIRIAEPGVKDGWDFVLERLSG